MAIVKTLIVKGVARFMTDAYMSTIRSGIWNGSTIQVGYGGTGVTSARGDQYTPVFLSSSGIAPCSVEIPHTTKNFTINGVTYAVFTNSAGTAPTIVAPTALAGTGGYILATNSGKTGLEWVAKPTGNVATSAVVASSATGTTQITAAQTDPFYNLLEGGAVARSIQFKHGDNMTISSTTGGVITFTASNTWRNIYVSGTSVVATGTGTKAMNFASSNLGITYLAAGTSTGQSGNAAYFTIDIEANDWTGATDSVAGTDGYMPGAAIADRLKFLRGDGSWVALSQTDHTHSVKINGSTKTIAAPGGTAVDLGNYVQLDAGATEQTIKNSISSLANGSIEIWRATSGGYAMIGFANGTTKTKLGMLGFGATANNPIFRTTGGVDYLLAHAGNISNKSATIGTTLTTIATIAGVDIKAKIQDVTAQVIELASVQKTLVVSTWTDMAAISTYSGTYAIQISDGTLYASGIFSVCGGTDTIIDEIPLHVSSTGATWRPYARISAGQLQMTTNEATGTARTYTIKILKLI